MVVRSLPGGTAGSSSSAPMTVARLGPFLGKTDAMGGVTTFPEADAAWPLNLRPRGVLRRCRRCAALVRDFETIPWVSPTAKLLRRCAARPRALAEPVAAGVTNTRTVHPQRTQNHTEEGFCVLLCLLRITIVPVFVAPGRVRELFRGTARADDCTAGASQRHPIPSQLRSTCRRAVPLVPWPFANSTP